MKERVLEKRLFDVSKQAEIIEVILIGLLAFLTPLIVPQLLNLIFGSGIGSYSQYIVGTIVNSALIVAGINAKGWKKVIGIVTLPSLSALTSGLVLQTGSIYTVYMIPAIWIGNFAIIYLYKYLFIKKKFSYAISSIIAILTKVMAIFVGYNLLLAINLIPNGSVVAKTLYTAMGMNQLITALLGSVLAFGIVRLIYRKNIK